MQFALTHPQLLTKLIVADIAPKTYPAHHQYILKALSEVDFSTQNTRKDIENVLSTYIKESGIVQFLMKNIYRKDKQQLAYRFNLPVLREKYNEVITSFTTQKTFTKPTLFLKGSKSNYITTEDSILINNYFTNASVQEISNAGHWLHAENSQEFYSKTMKFC